MTALIANLFLRSRPTRGALFGKNLTFFSENVFMRISAAMIYPVRDRKRFQRFRTSYVNGI